MATESTDTYALPYIVAGQAQKEVTHNDALDRIDALLQVRVVGVGVTTPPAAPVFGQSWIIGAGASGIWAGKAQQIACFGRSGWRYFDVKEGFAVWNLADAKTAVRTANGWALGSVNATELKIDDLKVVGARQAAIGFPAGGTVVDTEARLALSAVIAALRTHGLIAL